MPSITLEVQSAKLTSKFGSDYGVDQHGEWVLTGTVKLPWRERLELGTGEKADELQMHLTFRETDAELVEWATERTKDVEDAFKRDKDTVCGTVTYHKAWEDRDGLNGGAASIIFYVFTPPDVMASLIRFAENGRFLKRVTVEVRGMEYGYAPDGSHKRWLKNTDDKMLPIVTVDYELPLHEEPEEEHAPGEPITSVGADLAPILHETLKWVKGAVWLLAAVAGALVFKGWR